MKLETFSNEHAWIDGSTTFIEEALNTFPGPIALSGGKTPLSIYEAIATRGNIRSSSIEVFQVDERYVPPEHPDSNQTMIMEHLIKKDMKPTFSGFSHFDTNLPIEKAVQMYEKKLAWITPASDGFAITVLGLGPDGHTASLFPHSPALHERTHLVAHTQTEAFPIRDRLTLTFPALLPSKKILLLLKGKDKQTILDDLLHSDKTVDELPAKKLLEHPDLTIHYCQE